MKKREITLLTDFIIQDLTAAELEKRYEMGGIAKVNDNGCGGVGGSGGCPTVLVPKPSCDTKGGACFIAENQLPK